MCVCVCVCARVCIFVCRRDRLGKTALESCEEMVIAATPNDGGEGGDRERKFSTGQSLGGTVTRFIYIHAYIFIAIFLSRVCACACAYVCVCACVSACVSACVCLFLRFLMFLKVKM